MWTLKRYTTAETASKQATDGRKKITEVSQFCTAAEEKIKNEKNTQCVQHVPQIAVSVRGVFTSKSDSRIWLSAFIS